MKNPNQKDKTSGFRKYIIRTILSGIVLAAAIYLVIDYHGPRNISLKKDTAFGLPCLRARDLIVHEYDQNGTLWASRGMIIYRLDKGRDKFTRVSHVPAGLSIYWLRNFTLLRRFTLRPECIEMVTTDSGDICAFSAGKIWYLASGEKKFKETFILAHYGLGDQGLRNDGILYAGDSTLYYGEYFYNAERTFVNLYESKNNGKSWKVAYNFPAGQIRHIHAIQKDPFSGKLWICTGDKDKESMIAFSADTFKTITPIGQGSQIWRTCQLVFTESEVYWGTDTGHDVYGGIYSWYRESNKPVQLIKSNRAVFYGIKLAGGTIVMSTNREGRSNETDDKTIIYIITDDDQITSLEAGTWKSKKPGFWFKFAKLRFQRDSGGPALVISCLNQKEFPDGDLLIIDESALIEAAGSN